MEVLRPTLAPILTLKRGMAKMGANLPRPIKNKFSGKLVIFFQLGWRIGSNLSKEVCHVALESIL